MGLWHWIVGQLTEPQDAPAGGGSGGTAVATVEGGPSSSRDEATPPWWAPEGATLTEPPPVVRPDLSTEARALENMLVSHFDGHDLSMPPLLHVAERVLPRLSSINCDLSEVTDELSSDQVIAAALLRMANSPLYRGLNKIETLQAAVSRLGLKALRTLLLHESLRSAMFTRKGAAGELAKLVWCQSLASGFITRGLADFTTVDKENAFLIGLLHDIGNVIVLRIMHGAPTRPRFEVDVDTFDYLCSECHQEFGELIADAWSLPPDLKSLISNHHVYPAPDDPLRTERLLLQVADMIGAMLGYGPSATYNLLETRAVRDLGLAEHKGFISFLERLPEETEEAVGAF